MINVSNSQYDENIVKRLAWGIVISSFFLLCTLTLSLTVGVYFFFFESTISLDAIVRVGRGTAVITDANVEERALRLQDILVGRPAVVSTDLQSQTQVTFDQSILDPNEIATLILQPNTTVEIGSSLQPRFDWSNGQYEIQITDVNGLVDIVIPPTFDRAILLQISTSQGGLIHITGSGRYVVDVNDNRLRFVNRFGTPAVIFGRDRSQNIVVDGGKTGLLYASRAAPAIAISSQNLLENSYFFGEVDIEDAMASSRIPTPERWGCTNVQDQLPRGEILVSQWQGRDTLRLLRSEDANSNGQTRCKHPFAGAGVDIREFNYLELDTTFLLNYQSLSECGIEGSECPLMLHIEYIDVNGVPREWYKGFYYNLDPQFNNFKSRCASCIEDHQRINEKTWYNYRTGNLFTNFNESQRPAFITNIEFYASGHQYDVFVSDIALMAGISDAVPSTINIDTTAPADD